jgi:hypothetical protein
MWTSQSNFQITKPHTIHAGYLGSQGICREKGQTKQGCTGKQVRPEGFFTSLVENIYSATTVQLAHSTVYSDTYQKWLTVARAGLTK